MTRRLYTKEYNDCIVETIKRSKGVLGILLCHLKRMTSDVKLQETEYRIHRIHSVSFQEEMQQDVYFHDSVSSVCLFKRIFNDPKAEGVEEMMWMLREREN